MKLTEIRGEEALDVMADLMDPIIEICDDEIIEMYRAKKPYIVIIKQMIKGHKKSCIELLAILNREDPKEFEKNLNLLTLPRMLLELFYDKEVQDLFTLQAQMAESESFGPATETTTETETM